MFSMIRIDKQSLNHEFWGFILILSVSWGQLRPKCPHHVTFFHRPGTFFIFCGNINVTSDGHYESDDFFLTTWTLSSGEVVKLKFMRYSSQHSYIRIFTFPVFAFHRSSPSFFTNILISKPETRQILLLIYLFPKQNIWKCIKFIYRPLISNFSKIFHRPSFPLVWTIVMKGVVNFSEFSKNFFTFTWIFLVLSFWFYFNFSHISDQVCNKTSSSFA